eukprot:scaffold86411_cov21-Tisochrysis_lutea.AAC.1
MQALCDVYTHHGPITIICMHCPLTEVYLRIYLPHVAISGVDVMLVSVALMRSRAPAKYLAVAFAPLLCSIRCPQACAIARMSK